MAFFKKNPNEAAYVGGQKHWADVIKNTCPGDQLIFRQPEEDFNTNSTLIVMPGEAAIFVKGGVIEQVFDSGTYQLSTQNYPFISRLKTAFTGGISTFNCVVYFVKTAHTTEIKWGTKVPIEVRDKVRRIVVKVRGFGAYRVQVQNPAKFLEKMIGNNYYSATAEGLRQFFESEFQSKICTSIARAMNESNQEILGIAAHQEELSHVIQPMIQEAVEPYGLRCVNFSIAGLTADAGQNGARFEDINMDAYAKVANAQADRAVMDTLGNQWAQQQSFDLMNNMAKAQANGAQNPMMNATMGFGMGVAAGNVFGNMAQQTFAPAGQQAPVQQAAPAAEDPVEVLGKLKRMLDAGLIEQAEYDAKKAEILSKM